MYKESYRDAMLVPLESEELLVMACDSCGAIGMKEQDVVRIKPYISGKYTVRVSLMEVLSLGAELKGVTVNICNELNPTGQEILDGIKSELEECHIEVAVRFSTEKNMTTSMTALGVTVAGVVKKNHLLLQRSFPGDLVYVVGKPKVGNEVVEDQGEIATTRILMELLKLDRIQEIIPVGSSGIKGEFDKFLKFNLFDIKYVDEIPIDIHKSAGPCTAMIVICREELSIKEQIPYCYIGRLCSQG